MRLRFYILFSLILVTTPTSAGQYNLKFTGGIDTTIIHVSTGGLWEQGVEHGSWRLIVRNLGWEHTRSFLYLQWLKTDEDKNKVIELKTIPIPEFNTGDWRNVLKVEYQNNGFTIYYVLRGQKGILKATLKPKLPGKYRIKF